MRITTIEEMVYDILNDDIRARNDNSYLYFKVCQAIAKDNGIDLSSMNIEFFLTIASKNYPSFESVTRTRRKVQEKNPFLMPDEIIKAYRRQQEEAYREYARKKA